MSIQMKVTVKGQEILRRLRQQELNSNPLSKKI